MKKILLLFVAVATLLLNSCSSEDSVITEKSSALRLFLKEMKATYNISGRTTTDEPEMCFEFVYPITLSYNNGTTIVVSSRDELISILENESDQMYVDGIAFPFEILVSGNTTAISIADEDAFWDALANCNIETYDDAIDTSDCFTFVYPFSIVTNTNQTQVITSEDALHDLIDDCNEDYFFADFVYPFSVVFNNETLQINNAYEFEELLNNCVTSNCNCPTVIDPVCVATPQGIIEFQNECIAECNGFNSDDFVDCSGNSSNDSFEDVLEDCMNIAYPVQVQFNGAVITAQSDAQLVTLYNPNQSAVPAFNYPIVVSFEDNPSQTYTVASEAGLLELIQMHCN